MSGSSSIKILICVHLNILFRIRISFKSLVMPQSLLIILTKKLCVIVFCTLCKIASDLTNTKSYPILISSATKNNYNLAKASLVP